MIYKEKVNVLEMLKRHEGIRLERYQCSAGVWTIGYGHTFNIGPRATPITIEQAEAWLFEDIQKCIDDLNKHLPWWTELLSHNRQAVMIDMCFNLGISKLKKFTNTLNSIKTGDYKLASWQMLQSKWAKQVGSDYYESGEPQRALELSFLMEDG